MQQSEREALEARKKRYEDLFEDLKLDFWPMMFYPFFILRRVILVFTLVLMT
jgi:hypothetical protein